MQTTIDKMTIANEVKWSTARSGGAGGQHVNKVETKAILKFNIQKSNAFKSHIKHRLLFKLSSKITEDGILVIHSQDSQSQHKNKEIALKRLYTLLEQNSIEPKKRKVTKPSRGAVERRITSKKNKSSVKKGRRINKNNFDF